jgi:hypothetical protein
VVSIFAVVQVTRRIWEDQQIAARVKDEARSTTADETRKAVNEGKRLRGGFGDVRSKEHAQKCVEQALDDYILRKNEGMRDAPITLSLNDPYFSKLLSYKVVGVTESPQKYVVTVNLQVETSAGLGVVGGGPTRTRQARYAVEKVGGLFDLAD